MTGSPPQSRSYFAATSRRTGANAVEPVRVRVPLAQPIGGRVSSWATTIAARVTALAVSARVISRAARLNSGGFSSGVALRLGHLAVAQSADRRISSPTSPPDRSTSSLKGSPRLSGTRGMRRVFPS
jgi:hypothetical protein